MAVVALVFIGLAACTPENDPLGPFALEPVNGVHVYLPLYRILEVGDTARIDAEGFHDGNGFGTEPPHTVAFAASDPTVVRLESTTWTLSIVPTVRVRGLRPGSAVI